VADWAAACRLTGYAPLRLTLGNGAADTILGSLERGLADIAFGEPVARKAGFGARSGHAIGSPPRRRTPR
jgi:hypothetical protein